MSRDLIISAVRYGRVPKRSRERIAADSTEMNRVSTTNDNGNNADNNSVDSNNPPQDLDAKQIAMYDLAIIISQAHHANCPYLEERMAVAKEIKLDLPLHPESSSPTVTSSTASNDVYVVSSPNPDGTTQAMSRNNLDDSSTSSNSSVKQGAATSTVDIKDFQKIWLWQNFASSLTPGVQRVVEFAKRVPGFCDLSQDDQLILIKLGFVEIWFTHVSRSTNNVRLMFDDGVQFTRHHVEILYDSDFATEFFQFIHSFNDFQLNDSEIGLFSAIVLLSGDRAGLTDIKAIDHNREQVIEGLRLQLERNHGDSQMLTALLTKLSDILRLGHKHAAHLEWLRAHWRQLKLPPLFAEIFDIPKTEEDLLTQ